MAPISRRKLKKTKYLQSIRPPQFDAAKVIIRNLSFQASKEDIKDCFAKYGPIREVLLPYAKDLKRGFAFVTFEHEASAKQALLDNINILGRPVVVSRTTSKKPVKLPKSSHQTSQKETQENTAEQSQDQPEEVSDTEIDQLMEEDEGVLNDSDDLEESEPEQDKEETKEESEAEQPPAPYKPAVAELQRLLIQNLPYDAKKSDLKKLLLGYGHLKKCVLLNNNVTGHPLGMALVKFKHHRDAKFFWKVSQNGDGLKLGDRTVRVGFASEQKTTLLRAPRKKSQMEAKDS